MEGTGGPTDGAGRGGTLYGHLRYLCHPPPVHYFPAGVCWLVTLQWWPAQQKSSRSSVQLWMPPSNPGVSLLARGVPVGGVAATACKGYGGLQPGCNMLICVHCEGAGLAHFGPPPRQAAPATAAAGAAAAAAAAGPPLASQARQPFQVPAA